MGFSLFIREGSGSGQTLTFDQPEVTFGRVTDNDVVLYDPDVSRKHFSIVLEGGVFVLKDLGSSNGTLLNGEAIDAYPLSAGDEIRVGALAFEFKPDAAKSNLPARRPRQREAAPVASAPRPQPPARTPARTASRDGENLPAQRRAPGGAMATAPPASARERFKAKQAASTPVGRLKLWFGGLSQRGKIIVYSCSGVLALGLVLLVVKGLGEDEPTLGMRDISGNIVNYERRMSEWAFGNGPDDLTHLARANLGFAFPYRDGRVTLTFDAGFIDGENEVEIRLNEERLVGYAPLAIGTWVRDVQVVLPHNGLVPNSMNTIVFDQIRNPGARPPAKWAIRNLRIDENPLPSPDPHRADERFQLAQQRWRSRAIGPRNLYDACRYYREARDYLELIEVKPPLYDEVVARIRECTVELETIYRRLLFEAQKHEQYREWDRAKATLQQILEYFPDETDPRNRTIQNWLRTYN